MFCTKCGKELKDGVRFCTACGAEIKSRASVETIRVINEEDSGIRSNAEPFKIENMADSYDAGTNEEKSKLRPDVAFERLNNHNAPMFQEPTSKEKGSTKASIKSSSPKSQRTLDAPINKKHKGAGVIVVIVLVIILAAGLITAIYFLGGREWIAETFGIGADNSVYMVEDKESDDELLDEEEPTDEELDKEADDKEENDNTNADAIYVTKLDDIPQKLLDAMDIKIKRGLEADIEGLKEIALQGYYFLSSADDKEPNNYLYLVYAILEEDDKNGLQQYYSYGCYENICKTENISDMVDIDDFSMPDKSESFKFSKDDKIKHTGYRNLSEMYDNLVLTRLDYNVESTVEEAEGDRNLALNISEVPGEFYGIWVAAYQSENDAQKLLDDLKASGLDGQIYLTSDWSNLNSKDYYAVTAGIYNDEETANEYLDAVRKKYSDAYVKYSGEYIGEVYSDELKTVILPESNSRYITEDELDKLTADECRLARNEIYARHGRRFVDESVQAYFDGLDWYEGTIDAEDFSESVLNEYERKNADMILEYESKKGYR